MTSSYQENMLLDYSEQKKSEEELQNLSFNNSDSSEQFQINNKLLTQIEVFLLSCLFVLTVIGNLTVILIILLYRNMSSKRARWFKLNKNISRMSFYIIHLSIADLNVAFMSILPQLIWRQSVVFNHSHFLCKFVAFSQVFSVYASTFLLIVMAYDRFKCICWPIKSCSWNCRHALIGIFVAWIIAATISSPQLFLFKIQHMNAHVYTVETCSVKWMSKRHEGLYLLFHMSTHFLIPFFVLTYLYSRIFLTVSRNISRKHASVRFERESSKTGTEINQLNRENSLNTQNGLITEIKNESENSIFRDKKTGIILWLRSHFNKSIRHKILYTSTKKSGKNIKFSRSQNFSLNNSLPKEYEMKLMLKKNDPLSESDNRYSMRLDKNSVYSKSFKKNFPIRQTFTGKALTKSKIKTLKLTLTVVITYVMCSLPFYVCTFIHFLLGLSAHNHSNLFTKILVFATISTNMLFQLNSCANPFIYLFFNGNICKIVKRFKSKT